MGKPKLHVLDLADDSIRSLRPRVPPAADDSLAGLKARGGPLDVPASGIAFYVETENIAKAGRGVTLTGPNVVHYHDAQYGPPPRSDMSTRVLRQGRRITGTPNGCDFPGEMVLELEAVVAVTELSYDPQRCLSLVQVGVSKGKTASESAEGSSGESKAAPLAKATNISANAISAAAIPNYHAWTRSQVRELAYPLLKPPSEVYTKVDVYNGEPTYAPTFAHYTHAYLSGTGWYNTYLKWTYNFTVNYARSTIHASYRNDIAGRVLCGILGGSTYSSHYPTEVRGYRDGHAEYSANTTKSGNCSYLLRVHQENGRYNLS
jgi:hypothetical protein